MADSQNFPSNAGLDEVIAAYLRAAEVGLQPDRQLWLRQHPEIAAELQEYFNDEDRIRGLTAPLRQALVSESVSFENSPDAVSESNALVRNFGDYELLQEIARGGMGVVYKARQVSLNRIVALKMLRFNELFEGLDTRRFRAEAEAAANLDHPNIVPLYEVGEHSGQHYFTMKLMEGGSLAGRMTALRQDTQLFADILAQVALSEPAE